MEPASVYARSVETQYAACISCPPMGRAQRRDPRAVRPHMDASRKSWIAPIPGTTNPGHLDDFLGAGNIRLTSVKWKNSTGNMRRSTDGTPCRSVYRKPNRQINLFMKKIRLVSFLLVAVLSTVACGSSDREPFTPGQPRNARTAGWRRQWRTRYACSRR